MSNQLFTKRARWQHGDNGNRVTRPYKPTNLLLIVVGVVIAANLMLQLPRLFSSNAGITATSAPTMLPLMGIPTVATLSMPPKPALLTATSAPICSSAQGYLSIIAAQEAMGNYAGAAVNAEAALRITGLCPNDYSALKRQAISVGISALYTEPFSAPLDTASQQHLVDRYESLRSQAQASGITIDTDLQIARRAFAISQFALAKAALDNAFATGQFDPATDREITHLYISTCYGLGAWYSTASKGSSLYAQGLAWLAASHALSVQYHAGQAEAATKLAELVSSNELDWPAPAATPLLKTQ